MKALLNWLERVDWAGVGETIGGVLLVLALIGLLVSDGDGACWQWMCP